MNQLNYKIIIQSFLRITSFIVFVLLLNFDNAIAQIQKARDSSSKKKLIEIGHPTDGKHTKMLCGYHGSKTFIVGGVTVYEGKPVKTIHNKSSKKKIKGGSK